MELADQEPLLVPTLHAGSRFGKFIFSFDSRYLFCSCGSLIKVFNTTNGECLHDLIGHTAMVTGVIVNPSNNLQLISCGQDGLLIYWDYLDGVQLKQHDFHMGLYGIISINAEKKSIMMIAQTSKHSGASLLQWWKAKNSKEFSKPKVLLKSCNKDQNLVSFGCNNEYAASAEGTEVTVYSMKKSDIIKVIKETDKRMKTITCVACHPTEYYIATGLESGMIMLWYNFYKQGQPSLSTIHWHSLPVLCLNFSPDGSILLSGGHECVLVRWQMNNTNQRDFKPRMGAPLDQVVCSPDGNFYATGHTDNVIQMLDINLKILQVYRGLSRTNMGVNRAKTPIPVGLVYDPRSRALVTNGLPGHLQFFSLPLQRQLYNLDIVGQNYISPENLDQPLVITEVKQAAISSDGVWLATFEIWEDNFFSSELRLKFWQYSTEAQTYVLNTTVEAPHDKEINSMCFRPPLSAEVESSAPTLVTTACDQCFKAWKLVDDTDIYRENTRWDCDSVGFYKNLNPSCCDYSSDGSSLAIAFDHLLTLWDSDNNVIRKTLSCPLTERKPISSLKFGFSDSRYFLVMTTKNLLLSWNLLTLTVEWSMDIRTWSLIRDPDTDLMAFVSRDNSFQVFRPKQQELVYRHDNVSSSRIISAVFIPKARPQHLHDVGWPGSSQVYLYNQDDHLLTLESPVKQNASSKVTLAQNLSEKSLASIIAEKVVREADKGEVKETQRKTKFTDDSFITTMLHSYEPVSMYGEQYLYKLLEKKKKSRTSSILPSLDDDSVESDEEGASKSSGSEDEDDRQTSKSKSQPPSSRQEVSEVSPTVTDDEEDYDRILPKLASRMTLCSSLSL